MLTQDKVKEIFIYQEGELYYRDKRPFKDITKPAGYVRPDGYGTLHIGGKYYLKHRVVYLYHYGSLPPYLDHIDRNPWNNRIENLRPASNVQNGMNTAKGRRGKSIYKGVSPVGKKWRACIQISGVKMYLGLFEDEHSAAMAYNCVAKVYLGDFACLNDIPALHHFTY